MYPKISQQNVWSVEMVKLYKSSSGIVHLVQGGYICIHAIGKVENIFIGNRDDITCKNCRGKLN
ncbi:MAG TPA: hypothetical protein VLE21_04705 [Candidatus Nitrosocosmicus sp.]|nr:hypothetical protein [Candidatus Nitrosocosmicus sp.]